MLRVKGMSLKEQLSELKKNPELALTTGRPLNLEKPAKRPRAKHPGLKPLGVKKEEAKSATNTGTKAKKS